MFRNRKNTARKGTLKVNDSYEGETLEVKIRRLLNNKEDMGEPGVPLIYTERQEGVQAAYDIRTDRFEIAVEAKDYVTRSRLADRDNRHKTPEQIQAEETERQAEAGRRKIKKENLAELAKKGMEKEGEA